MKKIAIHSVPRSGSTWLGHIFNSHPNVSFKYQPLFSYAFKDYLGPCSTSKEIQSFFKEIMTSDDAFINQRVSVQTGIVPEFKKSNVLSHCCYKEVRYHYLLKNMLEQSSDLKLILLVRNPLAVIYSWSKAPKEFKTEQGWIFEDEWLYASKKNLDKPEEFNGYAKWKETALMFQNLEQLYANQVSLVTYNHLLSDTSSIVKQLYDFTELDMNEQTLEFIKRSKSIHNKDAYSVYKKRVIDEDWKQLPQSIIDYITKDLEGTKLEQYLYE